MLIDKYFFVLTGTCLIDIPKTELSMEKQWKVFYFIKLNHES